MLFICLSHELLPEEGLSGLSGQWWDGGMELRGGRLGAGLGWAGLERQDVPEGCPQGWCGSGRAAVPLAPRKCHFLPSGQGFGGEVVCEVGQKRVLTGGGSHVPYIYIWT